MDRAAIIFTIVGAWMIGVAAIIRLVIPALINSQIDGAIILAVAVGFGTALSPFFVWQAIKPFISEQNHEG